MLEQINRFKHLGLFLILFICANSSQSNTNEPPTIGNFSLESSQQPGPLFSFGQNIVNKKQLLVSFNPSYLYSRGQSIIEGDPSLLYGVTDSLSLLLTVPYALKYTNSNNSQSGIGDLGLDLEYAFYTFENSKYSDQAIVMLSSTFPISTLEGISKKNNPTQRASGFSRKNNAANFSAISYFIGGSYSRMLVDWYAFVSPGVLLVEKQNSIQQGTQSYYNVGLGHNIKSAEKKYIFAGLLEINGQYSNKTKIGSATLPNTGGNIIYATPSLWFSTPKFIFQIGISLPIAQYWYGNQSNISYYTSSILTWTIH